MCSYTIRSRYQVARLRTKSRYPIAAIPITARSVYDRVKIKSRRPHPPCDVTARASYNSVKQKSDLLQIALIDGDGAILLDDLGNVLIIGYCYA